jgi:hypothetical protein
MRSGGRGRAIRGLLLALVVLTPAAPAHNSPYFTGWGAPHRLASEASGGTTALALATDGQGTYAAAWREQASQGASCRIRIAIAPAYGHEWTTGPANEACNGQDGDLAVLLPSPERLVVVWSTESPPDTFLMADFDVPSMQWLSAFPTPGGNQLAAASAKGTVLLAFRQTSIDGALTQVARVHRSPEGAWSVTYESALPEAAADVGNVSVALDDAGRGVLAWTAALADGSFAVVAQAFEPQSGWRAAQRLVISPVRPSLATAADEGVGRHVLYTDASGGTPQVVARQVRADGSFEDPVRLSQVPATASRIVAASAGGLLKAAWRLDTPCCGLGSPAPSGIHLATRTAINWQTEEYVTTTKAPARLCMAPFGMPVVSSDDGFNFIFDPTQPSPQTSRPQGKDFRRHALACDDEGNHVMLWLQDVAGVPVPMAARYTFWSGLPEIDVDPPPPRYASTNHLEGFVATTLRARVHIWDNAQNASLWPQESALSAFNVGPQTRAPYRLQLDDGNHVLRFSSHNLAGFGTSVFYPVSIKTTPLPLKATIEGETRTQGVRLRIETDPGATVLVLGQNVTADENGLAHLDVAFLKRPHEIEVRVRDAWNNTNRTQVALDGAQSAAKGLGIDLGPVARADLLGPAAVVWLGVLAFVGLAVWIRVRRHRGNP